MRIAFLLEVFPKTSESFIVNQIVGLIERGHTVDIFARYRNVDDPIDSQVKKHQLVDRTHYLSIPTKRPERLLAAAKILLGHSQGIAHRRASDQRAYGRGTSGYL
jgi:colanic acid/amylovoran biosynthesis glycosyltransferase